MVVGFRFLRSIGSVPIEALRAVWRSKIAIAARALGRRGVAPAGGRITSERQEQPLVQLHARSNVDYFFDHCVPASSTSNQKLADHIDACIKHDQIRASCRPIDQAMSHWPL